MKALTFMRTWIQLLSLSLVVSVGTACAVDVDEATDESTAESTDRAGETKGETEGETDRPTLENVDHLPAELEDLEELEGNAWPEGAKPRDPQEVPRVRR